MDIYVTDDTIGRYFRRLQLAFRLLAHGARAQTVCDWSGLTRDQLITLRRRWGFDADEGRRGPAPSSYHIFFRSKRHRTEAALFAGIYRIIRGKTSYDGRDAAKQLSGLENGEMLCEALEAFHEWLPESSLEFEHAVLLAMGVTQTTPIALGHCPGCHAVILVDRQGRVDVNCVFCARPVRRPLASNADQWDHWFTGSGE